MTTVEGKTPSLHAFAERLVNDLTHESVAARSELSAALPADLLAAGDLPDLSPAGHQRVESIIRQAADKLPAVGTDDPITFAVIDYFLRVGQPGGIPGVEGFGLQPWFHDPFGYGRPLLDYAELMGDMRIVDATDATAYLERLDATGRFVDGILEGVEQRADLGLVSTATSIGRTCALLDGLAAEPPAESDLVTSFASRLAAAGIPAGLFVDRATELVRDRVMPSWARLAARGRADLPAARAELGLCSVPGGDAAYAYAVKAHTTTELTAAELHTLGLGEVERLHEEIRAEFSQLGFAGADVGDLYRSLGMRAELKYADGDRRAVIDDVTSTLADLDVRMRPYFTRWPAGVCPVEIVPPALEATMPSHVRAPRATGLPCTFGLNVADALASTRADTRVLTFHEAIPGHALQGAVAAELTTIPPLRRALSFTAYAEGWAKYAETLPGELGLYPDDPYLTLARLRYELFSTVNLVADTGCNLHGWDAARTASYCSWATGDDIVVPRMIPLRAVHTPGQLLGYKVGMMEMRRVRASSEAALGSAFDLVAFHDGVLGEGAVPLPMLGALVGV